MRITPAVACVLVGLLGAACGRAHDVAAEMRAAAQAWLEALDDKQRADAVFPLVDPERENWSFVPRSRQGVSLKRMTAPQRELALALLRTGLSHRGWGKAEAIIALENVLRELEKGASWRDPELYHVTIFGTPAEARAWGWRFEGHHLSFNFTLDEQGRIAFAPSFMGSNPAEVRSGANAGLRVLGEEEDLGLALVNALHEEQRRKAIFAARALPEIVTTNEPRVHPLEPAGIAAADLALTQQEQLWRLIRVYLERWRGPLADETWAEIEAAGLPRITFGWAGGLSRGEQTYYRIQGPTFLIEFDNFQGRGNHIHTTFREFDGDFGRDLLREHYEHGHHSTQ